MNGHTLNIFDWNGSAGGGGTTQLIDSAGSGNLSGTDLANISFYSGNSTSSGFLGNGTFAGNEIVPVPEPSVLIAAALLLGWLIFSQRTLLMRCITRRSE